MQPMNLHPYSPPTLAWHQKHLTSQAEIELILHIQLANHLQPKPPIETHMFFKHHFFLRTVNLYVFHTVGIHL